MRTEIRETVEAAKLEAAIEEIEIEHLGCTVEVEEYDEPAEGLVAILILTEAE